jgi:hypothetical protein
MSERREKQDLAATCSALFRLSCDTSDLITEMDYIINLPTFRFQEFKVKLTGSEKMFSDRYIGLNFQILLHQELGCCFVRIPVGGSGRDLAYFNDSSRRTTLSDLNR